MSTESVAYAIDLFSVRAQKKLLILIGFFVVFRCERKIVLFYFLQMLFLFLCIFNNFCNSNKSLVLLKVKLLSFKVFFFCFRHMQMQFNLH